MISAEFKASMHEYATKCSSSFSFQDYNNCAAKRPRVEAENGWQAGGCGRSGSTVGLGLIAVTAAGNCNNWGQQAMLRYRLMYPPPC